jgi:hypothetical protein
MQNLHLRYLLEVSKSRGLYYFLRSILLVANINVSTTKMFLDISILAKSIMDRREYLETFASRDPSGVCWYCLPVSKVMLSVDRASRLR